MTEPEAKEASGKPLWAGRFGEGPADELLAFTVSLPYDRRLAVDDLAGSRAHVHMLERVGLLDEEERQVITAALEHVAVLVSHVRPQERRSGRRIAALPETVDVDLIGVLDVDHRRRRA